MVREVDAVVVGAGQAGLATSFFLSQRGIEHVVFDRAGVADSWRSRRWDSFALNSPNWSFSLPGFPYDGADPDGFMLRDEIVERLAAYARLIGGPVEAGVDVTALSRTEEGRYRLFANGEPIVAKAVVVATGPYQRHHRPANDLDPSILQLDTDDFRNAGDLQDGGVLIVGSGQSGCQIAEDLLENGRAVWLATGSCGWMPRRYRGRDNIAWRLEMGIFDETVEKLGHTSRRVCPPIQTGVGRTRDISLRSLHDAGIRLTGRLVSAEGTRIQFADDLSLNVASSDDFAQRFLARVDRYIRDAEIEAPDPPPVRLSDNLPSPPTELDLAAQEIRNVIWATGFRLDFSWIDLDLAAIDGYPEQAQGVSRYPGLYFMGLQLMHTRKSGLIFGVGEDAAHVASTLARHLGASVAVDAAAEHG